VLAFVRIEVTQGRLDEVGQFLAAIPEIIEASPSPVAAIC